ncbi:MAG: hypothetical protein ACOVQH_06175 [Burkholderiaceae bacterium]
MAKNIPGLPKRSTEQQIRDAVNAMFGNLNSALGLSGTVNTTDLVLWSEFARNNPATLTEYVLIQRRGPLRGYARARASLATVRDVAGPDAMDAINTGFSIGELTGGIGAAFGPLGGVVAEAVGFVGGIALGLWPAQRMDALARWRTIVGSLSPVERFGVLVGSYPIVKRALSKEGANPQPSAYRWGTDPPLGHTAWGGSVSNTVFMFEAMFEIGDVVPGFAVGRDGNTALDYQRFSTWLLCFVGGFHDNEKKVSEMRHAWPLLTSGRIAADLVPFLNSSTLSGQKTLGQLRRELASLGVPNLWDPPVIPSLRKALAG